MSKSGEEPPRMKKLKVCSPSPSPCLSLSSLPDDIILNCLARVSRSDHASLSLVSKWYYHSKVCSSKDLYKVRSLMGFTENFIYVCLRIPPDQKPRWFILHRQVLVPIPSHLFQPPEESSVVAHGCGIYVIGGRVYGRPSSRVFFLDCRTHLWSTLACMGVARASAAAGVVDGKIYMLGGCENPDSSRWGEVFDPKTQMWEALPMPQDHSSFGIPYMSGRAVMEEKVFALNESGQGLFYIPSQGIWKKGNSDVTRMRGGWYAIEDVMYSCLTCGRILWCEAEELECRTPQPKVINWREVMGLESLKITLLDSQLVLNPGGRMLAPTSIPGMELLNDEWYFPGLKLGNSGSNMLLFWDTLVPMGKMEIWCAEISLERRKERSEIWGKVEWSGPVMVLKNPLNRQHYYVFLGSLSMLGLPLARDNPTDFQICNRVFIGLGLGLSGCKPAAMFMVEEVEIEPGFKVEMLTLK